MKNYRMGYNYVVSKKIYLFLFSMEMDNLSRKIFKFPETGYNGPHRQGPDFYLLKIASEGFTKKRNWLIFRVDHESHVI